MHYCITCDSEIPKSEFYANKHKPSGLQDHCKMHQVQYTDQYYVENSKMILKKCNLRYKLKTGKLTKDQYEREFVSLTGKEPRTNKGYAKKLKEAL